MKLFISYSSAWRDLAKQMRLALEAEHHEVFMDRADLDAGSSFHQPIREAIELADRFIFLVTPESVAPGSYTLSELGMAERQWRRPAGRVLPVLVAPTPIALIPPYLKAVTMLEPRGDAVAEVVAAVADDSGEIWRSEIAAATKLCLTGSHSTAWDLFENIGARYGDSPDFLRAREDFAMLWLRKVRRDSRQATFYENCAKAKLALAQGLVDATGERAGDLRAHVGWADYLLLSNDAETDPVASYRSALADDPGNVFAHAMWGHWLMHDRKLGEAGVHFTEAVASSREREFVREMQLSAALWSCGFYSYAVSVANDMRLRNETLTGCQRERLWEVFDYHVNKLQNLENADDLHKFKLSSLPAAAELATFLWLFPSSEGRADAREHNKWRLCRAVLQMCVGELQPARAGLVALRDERKAAGDESWAYPFPELTDRLLAGPVHIQ